MSTKDDPIIVTQILFGDDEVEITYRELARQSKSCCIQETMWLDTSQLRDEQGVTQDNAIALIDLGNSYLRKDPVSYTRDENGEMVVIQTAGEEPSGTD